MLHQVGRQLLEIGILCVLGGDEHGRELDRSPVLVAHAHLGLAVGTQIGNRPSLSHIGQTPCQAMRQPDRERHEIGGLVAGVAENHALVARSLGVEHVLTGDTCAHLERSRHSLVDVRRLLVDGDQHAAGVPVETKLLTVIADLTDRPPYEAGDIDIGACRDLPRHDHQPGREHGLAGDAALGVLLEDRVEDGI